MTYLDDPPSTDAIDGLPIGPDYISGSRYGVLCQSEAHTNHAETHCLRPGTRVTVGLVPKRSAPWEIVIFRCQSCAMHDDLIGRAPDPRIYDADRLVLADATVSHTAGGPPPKFALTEPTIIEPAFDCSQHTFPSHR